MSAKNTTQVILFIGGYYFGVAFRFLHVWLFALPMALIYDHLIGRLSPAIFKDRLKEGNFYILNGYFLSDVDLNYNRNNRSQLKSEFQ